MPKTKKIAAPLDLDLQAELEIGALVIEFSVNQITVRHQNKDMSVELAPGEKLILADGTDEVQSLFQFCAQLNLIVAKTMTLQHALSKVLESIRAEGVDVTA